MNWMINTLTEGYFRNLWSSEKKAAVPEKVKEGFLDRGHWTWQTKMSKLLPGGERKGGDRHSCLQESHTQKH